MQFLNGSLLLAGCASVLCAQTYIVDAANGPGTHFTDIATATAVVPDGAEIVVRPGNYGAFTIANKGLVIRFDSGATVWPVLPVPVTVAGTSPQQVVVLRGMQIHQSSFGELVLTACQGPVLLSQCDIGGGGPNGKLRANGCSQLLCDTCTFGYLPGGTLVRLDNCIAVFLGCYMVTQATPSMDLHTSSIQLLDCAVGMVGLFNASAVSLAGSDLRMVGGSLYAGPLNVCIDGVGSTRIDPGVAHPFNPLFALTVQGTVVDMPAVVTAGGALGGSVTATMRGPNGDVGALLVGLPGPPLQVPGFADAFWLQPGTQSVCAFTVFATGVPLAVIYAVPNAPAMYGMRFAWQGVSFGTTNGLQASNPAVTVHY